MAFCEKHTVLLIEPSEVIATGLAAILEDMEDIDLVNVITDPEFEQELGQGQVDILIINPEIFGRSNMRNIRSYFSDNFESFIIALMSRPYGEDIIGQFDGNFTIYDSREDIRSKLDKVLKSRAEIPKEEKNELTPREKDILKGVAKGLTNKEIAFEYNISIYTVTTHRKNISRKLGINSISGLTVYAIMNNLIDFEDVK